MSDPTPNDHDSDDAKTDDGPPTDAFTDEVKADSAASDVRHEQTSDDDEASALAEGEQIAPVEGGSDDDPLGAEPTD